MKTLKEYLRKHQEFKKLAEERRKKVYTAFATALSVAEKENIYNGKIVPATGRWSGIAKKSGIYYLIDINKVVIKRGNKEEFLNLCTDWGIKNLICVYEMGFLP